MPLSGHAENECDSWWPSSASGMASAARTSADSRAGVLARSRRSAWNIAPRPPRSRLGPEDAAEEVVHAGLLTAAAVALAARRHRCPRGSRSRCRWQFVAGYAADLVAQGVVAGNGVLADAEQVLGVEIMLARGEIDVAGLRAAPGA
jgi:hypothetical protein